MAKHRGISAAARKMPYGIQQPAISGQVAQLEKAIGMRLFHRRPFGLTPAGAKLQSEIETFFSGLHELPSQVRGHSRQRLRLAAPAAIQRDYLPGILKEYKRRSRDFGLTLLDANQAVAEELLRKREIDIAITELEDRPAAFVRSYTLVRLPLVLVASKRIVHRSIRDFFHGRIPTESLISLPSDEVISKHFQSGLQKLGLGWAPSIEVSTLELIDTYAGLGFGAGVSVSIPGIRRKSDLRVIPLPKFPALNIAALWSGELSEPATTFLEDVRKLALVLNRRASLAEKA